MSERSKHMKLGVMLEGFGRTKADWRHPEWERDAGTKFEFHLRQVKLAEAAKLDLVFVADALYSFPESAPFTLIRAEPVTLLSALAAVTANIGLVATISTSYSQPFNVARQLAHLDQISHGRGGWNIVTSFNDGAAQNFNQPRLSLHEERYAMADESLDVAQGLWDSWEDDALVQDKEKGIFFDPEKLHILNHKGKYFQVKGPLNIPRSPQGLPVIFQAGTSDAGKDFAARRADCVFISPQSFENALAITGDIKQRTAAAGRDPNHVFVIPTTKAVVGSTEEEARAKYDARNEMLSMDDCFVILNRYFPGHDFWQEELDKPFPDHLFEKFSNNTKGGLRRISEVVHAKNMTLRQTALHFGRPGALWVGSPESLADKMQHWFERGAVDGYMFGETSPGEFKVVCEELVPILRKRGLFRAEYDHPRTTLRENLGVPRPENRYAVAKRLAAKAPAKAMAG